MQFSARNTKLWGRFHIPFPSNIWNWEKRLEQKGVDGLLSRRGRKLILKIENDFLKNLRVLDDK